MYDVAIVGCGIIGAAVAYELSKYQLDIVILEKENDVANGTSKANSGIIHAGFDPAPGSLMAQLNVEGNRLAKPLFERLDIPYKPCGSLVLTFSDAEVETLEDLLKTGRQNGVEGLEIWDRHTLLKREPHVSDKAKAALYAPSAMIVDPWEYTLALAETAVRNGATLLLEAPVTAIYKINGGCYRLQSSNQAVEARCVVNAAGLYADDIHNMVAAPAFDIRPDKGAYHLLDKHEGGRVNHVIFQCPTKAGKGVLVAPTVHGNLLVGPNNEKAAGRDDTAVTADGLAYVVETAKKSVPHIDFSTVIRQFAGNRAMTAHSDFVIAEAVGAAGFIDIAAIKSPGLSAAPAIAKMAARLLQNDGLALEAKQSFINTRTRVKFHQLSLDKKIKAVDENNRYGHVVCRCETITEGEIEDALRAPIPPRSVDGVKRRCGTGMGRCQGGFCWMRLPDIVAEECGLELTQVTKYGGVSNILVEKNKAGF